MTNSAGLRKDALAALSGVLLALSFPKFGHPAVAFVALAPLLLALPGSNGWVAFRLGYVTGAVGSLGLLYWTALVVLQYGNLPLVASVLIMTLLCLAVALFPSLFSWLVGQWLRRFGIAALLLAPFAWVATEILRAHTLLRFSWCLLGYSQAESPALIQVAAYTAVYGVSFLLALVSAAIAHAALERRRWRGSLPLLAALGLAGGAWLHGWSQLQAPLPAGRTLRVALVQASIRQDEKWDPGKLERNFGLQLELTRQAARAGARLVVWPESAVAWGFDDEPVVADALRGLVRDNGIALVFGNDDREPQPSGRDRVYVGAKLLDPSGGLALRYHKVRLVPFGEYVPLQPLLTLGGRVAARVVQQAADFTPGSGPQVGGALSTQLGVFICYEAIFPDFVRGFAQQGAELLVNVTNDAWYGTTSAPYQHFAMAVFRAVENGRPLVRAANTGISAFVDARGRVLARTVLFERTVLARELEIATLDTFYSRHGDVFAWGCFAAAAAISGLAFRPGRPAA